MMLWMLVIACTSSRSIPTVVEGRYSAHAVVYPYLVVNVSISVMECYTHKNYWYEVDCRARKLDTELILKGEGPTPALCKGMAQNSRLVLNLHDSITLEVIL